LLDKRQDGVDFGAHLFDFAVLHRDPGKMRNMADGRGIDRHKSLRFEGEARRL
jgi:hypothetical protein